MLQTYKQDNTTENLNPLAVIINWLSQRRLLCLKTLHFGYDKDVIKLQVEINIFFMRKNTLEVIIDITHDCIGEMPRQQLIVSATCHFYFLICT